MHNREMSCPATTLDRLGALSLAVVVGSCAPLLQNQSAESEELRTKVIPQLVAWAKSDSEQLNLGTLKTLRGFDYICYVWEYQKYRKIEGLVGPIQRYFGANAGTLVPESQIAIIAVRGEHAHVAHMDYGQFSIGRGGDKNCVALKHARLVKEPSEPGGHVLARLQADSASTS